MQIYWLEVKSANIDRIIDLKLDGALMNEFIYNALCIVRCFIGCLLLLMKYSWNFKELQTNIEEQEFVWSDCV